jgi:RNA polymerase sigma-70 factor, ECF subfamily
MTVPTPSESSELRASVSSLTLQDAPQYVSASIACEGRLSASEQSDIELLRGVTRRDLQAFETLYYRHAARLKRYLARTLRRPEAADEALNDVMLAIWQGAERFDPSVARPTTWFFAIAHKKALKAFARRRVGIPEEALESLDGEHVTAEEAPNSVQSLDPDTPERSLLGHELGRLLDEALEHLSLEHRTVIELAFAEERSYSEIATITGVPVNTVKSRMFYARKCLAAILQRMGALDISDPVGART